MGRVREGDGEWNEALGHYEAALNRLAAPGLLYPRLAAVRALAVAEEKEREARADCMWCSKEVVWSQVTDDEADVNLYLRCVLPVSSIHAHSHAFDDEKCPSFLAASVPAPPLLALLLLLL
jgi:hypothetical protein